MKEVKAEDDPSSHHILELKNFLKFFCPNLCILKHGIFYDVIEKSQFLEENGELKAGFVVQLCAIVTILVPVWLFVVCLVVLVFLITNNIMQTLPVEIEYGLLLPMTLAMQVWSRNIKNS